MDIDYSIVAAGAWNKNIINPNWLDKHVFKTKDLSNFQINYLADKGVLNFRTPSVLITPSDTKLIFSKFDVIDSQKVHKYFKTILAQLPHTPISGIGFNFDLKTKINSEIPNLFKIRETINNGFTLNEKKFQKGERGFTLNVTSTKLEDDFVLNFNFHFSPTQFEKIKNEINPFKKFTNKTMRYLK